MKKSVLGICALYAVLYFTIFAHSVVSSGSTSVLQWLVPPIILVALLSTSKQLDKVARWYNIVGVVVLIGYILIELTPLTNTFRPFSSAVLIGVVGLATMNLLNTPTSRTQALALGLAVGVLGMGIWEVIYQVGALQQHNFFGENIASFSLEMISLICFWIIPSIVVVRKHLRISIASIICICVSTSIAVLWVSTGMTITNTSMWLAILLRCSKVLLCLGLMLLMLHKEVTVA